MLLSRALLAPHLPTLLLDEHRHHETPMLQALMAESERLQAEPPEIVVALSTRWMSDGPFHVDLGKRHRTLTDYTGFGVECRYDCDGQPALARALVDAGTRAGVRVGGATRGVDSGVTVPLHFLLPRRQVPVVPLSLATLPETDCRAWGAVLRHALEQRPERILFVIGGGLSADLHAWQFHREVPETKQLDEHLLGVLRDGDWNALRAVAPEVLERGKPDGDLRHLDLLRGFLGADSGGTMHAYESLPGLGVAFVSFELPALPQPRAAESAGEASDPVAGAADAPIEGHAAE